MTPPAQTPDNVAKSSAVGATYTPPNLKVRLDDPTWKVLPAALKKYKVNEGDWQDYAMFVSYGNIRALFAYPVHDFERVSDRHTQNDA